MNIVQIYRTESGWCALIAQQEQRITLTYDAQPEEATVLEDAEAAFAAAENPDIQVPVVDESATLDDKIAIVRDQVTAASALAGTEPELAEVAAALDDVAALLPLAEGRS